MTGPGKRRVRASSTRTGIREPAAGSGTSSARASARRDPSRAPACRTGAIGLSTASAAELRTALPAGIVCVQNRYGLTSRGQEGVLDITRAEGIAWVPCFPLCGALPGSAKVTHEPVVRQVAGETGASPTQVGLSWLLRHGPDILIIPGTTSTFHLEQNIAAGSLALTDDQMARLDAVEPAAGVRRFLNRLRRP